MGTKSFLFLFISLLSILFCSVLIISEETSLDYGQDLNLNFNLDSVGARCDKLSNSNTVSCNFNNPNSSIIFDDKEISCVKSSRETRNPAYINFNSDGGVVKADFSSCGEPSILDFGEGEFFVPPNAHVFFDSSTKLLKVSCSNGCEVDNSLLPNDNSVILSAVTYSGNKMKFSDGFFVEKGDIHFDPENNLFSVPKGSISEVNEFSISASKTDVFVFEEVDIPEENFLSGKNYITFLNNKDFPEHLDGILVGGNGFEVNFLPKNYLIDFSQAENQRSFQIGDSGDSVKAIQGIVGMPENSIDGVYDSVTAEYVKTWQEMNGLSRSSGLGSFGSKSFDLITKDNFKIIPLNDRTEIFFNEGKIEINSEGDSIIHWGNNYLNVLNGEISKSIKSGNDNSLFSLLLNGKNLIDFSSRGIQTKNFESEYFSNPNSPINSVVLKLGDECDKIMCNNLDIEQTLRAKGVPNPEKWAEVLHNSALERQKEFDLPSGKLESLEALTAAIIDRESHFGDSELFKIENSLQSSSLRRSSSLGYMQVSDSVLEDNILNFEPNTDLELKRKQLSTIEGSVQEGQRYLSKLIQVYSPSDSSLNSNEVEIISAAYNSGIYTPRNAALQKQLQELGLIDKNIRLTGNLGSQTINALNNLIESYSDDENYGNYKSELLSINSLWGEEELDNSNIALLIREVYYSNLGREPEYAIVPEILTKDIRSFLTTNPKLFGKSRSTKDYAAATLKKYNSFLK
ncbi:hypothetical protein J4474_05085 [Candidatus Pacearchaeota archaeon]|nr:hypothetical protein [Candidatus Pacearchaeota archaeon]